MAETKQLNAVLLGTGGKKIKKKNQDFQTIKRKKNRLKEGKEDTSNCGKLSNKHLKSLCLCFFFPPFVALQRNDSKSFVGATKEHVDDGGRRCQHYDVTLTIPTTIIHQHSQWLAGSCQNHAMCVKLRALSTLQCHITKPAFAPKL